MATLHRMRLVPFLLATASWTLAGVASFSATAPTTPIGQAKPSKALFPFQKEGAARLVSDKRLLLADDMGLGKTVQSISAIHCLFENGEVSPSKGRVLIICPKSVVAVWVDELGRWLDERYFSIQDGLHIVSYPRARPSRLTHTHLEEQSRSSTTTSATNIGISCNR